MMKKVFEIKAQMEALNNEIKGISGEILKSEDYSLSDKMEVLRIAKPHSTYILQDKGGYIDKANQCELENGRRYAELDYDYIEYFAIDCGWIDEEYDENFGELELGSMNPEEQEEHYDRFVQSELDKIRKVFIDNGVYSYTLDW